MKIRVYPGDDIQAAMTALPDSGGVLVIEGPTAVPTTLTVTKQKIEIYGDGGARLIRSSGMNSALLSCVAPTASARLLIENLYLDGEKGSNTLGCGLRAYGYDGLRLVKLQGQNNPESGFWLGHSTIATKGVEIIDCHAGQNDQHGGVLQNVWDFKIRGGTWGANGIAAATDDTVGNNIYIWGGGEGHISDLSSDGMDGQVGRNGIALSGTSYVVLDGIFCHYNRAHGVLIYASNNITIGGGSQIIDNSRLGAGLGAGVRLVDSYDCLVVGNRITGALQIGVLEAGVSDWNRFWHNYARGCQTEAIVVGPNSRWVEG